VAVAFDAVGPGSTGQFSATSPVSWTHTPAGTPTAALAACAVGSSAGTMAPLTGTATYGGTAMTSLGRVSSGGGSTAFGYIELFALAAPLSGARTVSITPSFTGGTLTGLIGGSLTYTGTGSTSAQAFGTAVTASSSGNQTSGSAGVTGAGASNRVAGFACCGSGGLAVTGGTSRYLVNHDTSSGAGATLGADITSAAGAVNVTWTQTSDTWAAVAVEILGQLTVAGLASGAAAALFPATIPAAGYSGPNYPVLAADLGGGAAGLWKNPFLAEGAP
jgi:hypothetical protein